MCYMWQQKLIFIKKLEASGLFNSLGLITLSSKPPLMADICFKCNILIVS